MLTIQCSPNMGNRRKKICTRKGVGWDSALAKEELDNFHVERPLIVACTVDKANYKLRLHESVTNHLINALVILAIQGRCDGTLQNWMQLFSPKFFAAL